MFFNNKINKKGKENDTLFLTFLIEYIVFILNK